MRPSRRRAMRGCCRQRLPRAAASRSASASRLAAHVQLRLHDAATAPSQRRGAPLVGALLIQPLAGDALADTRVDRLLAARRTSLPSTSSPRWTERPVRQLPRLLQRRLEARGVADAVGLIGDPLRADWLLTAEHRHAAPRRAAAAGHGAAGADGRTVRPPHAHARRAPHSLRAPRPSAPTRRRPRRRCRWRWRAFDDAAAVARGRTCSAPLRPQRPQRFGKAVGAACRLPRGPRSALCMPRSWLAAAGRLARAHGGRSSLCEDCAVLLGPRSRRITRSAPCGRCARTDAASQYHQAREYARRPRTCAARRPNIVPAQQRPPLRGSAGQEERRSGVAQLHSTGLHQHRRKQRRDAQEGEEADDVGHRRQDDRRGLWPGPGRPAQQHRHHRAGEPGGDHRDHHREHDDQSQPERAAPEIDASPVVAATARPLSSADHTSLLTTAQPVAHADLAQRQPAHRHRQRLGAGVARLAGDHRQQHRERGELRDRAPRTGPPPPRPGTP